MNLSSKIYVAGHRGLVGSALMRRLTTIPSPSQGEGWGGGESSNGPYTNIITRTHTELDLTDQQAVRAFFEKEQPEYVFLAAAKVGGIHANNTYPAEFIQQNLAIQTNVIHEAWRNNVQRLLFLGSSCIYPKDCPQPIREEYLLTGPLEPTNRAYALAKIAGIEMCWSYNRQYGTRYIAAMPTNLYGPGDNYDLNNSHVLPALIRKMHLAKLAMQGDLAGIMRDEASHGSIPNDIKEMIGLHPNVPITQSSALDPRSPVILWGTGTPRREFLYSDDMADACLFLMNLPNERFTSVLSPQSSVLSTDSPPLVNVGCGEDLSIRELAELVKDVVGFNGNLILDSTKPDGTLRKLMDVSRLGQLGWHSHTALKNGIEKAYSDFQSNRRGT